MTHVMQTAGQYRPNRITKRTRFRDWAPLPVLLIALSTTLFAGGEAGDLHRPGHHNTNTALHMAVANNLSPEHRFLMFRHRWGAADGTTAYDLYNRFGVAGYALIKLAILPFEGNLAAQIRAARMLALAFFVATAVLACHALKRLTSNGWLATTATLLAFSSSYSLYYSDLPNPEVFMSLFGVLLVFHGAVVFAQDGRFPQFPVKACLALLLGWQVFALLLPLVAIGAVGAGWRAFKSAPAGPAWKRLRAGAAAALKSRHALAGGIALAFGSLILGWNLTNEHTALQGTVEWTELPSFDSMQRNVGALGAVYPSGKQPFTWGTFLTQEFRRIGVMVVPYGLRAAVGLGYGETGRELYGGGQHGAAQGGQHANPRDLAGVAVSMVGVGVFVAGLVALRLAKWKALTAVLLLTGFCWALPMRHQAMPHDFIALYHIGVPLVFFVTALALLSRRIGERALVISGAAAAAVFVYSATQMGRVGEPAAAAELRAAMLADFEVIGQLTAGARVFVAHRVMAGEFASTGHDVGHLVALQLPHSVLLLDSWGRRAELDGADFVVVPWRMSDIVSLTPNNQWAFLYERAAFEKSWRHPAPFGELLAESRFDVHWDTGRLLYVKDRCAAEDLATRLFLDASDDKRLGGIEFRFGHWGQAIGTRCVAAAWLPPRAVGRIRTGQRDGPAQLWSVAFDLPRLSLPAEASTAALGIDWPRTRGHRAVSAPNS